MFNLYEIMQAAQDGGAVDNLARQYGLSPEQTQAAVEALLPAFSAGLQRNSQDPAAFMNMLGMMGSGRYTDPFESAGAAFAPDSVQQGNDVLGQIFGSKDVSRQVAAQAAAASGIGESLLKQMLPVIAAMLMGGLFKSASNQGLGGILGQLGGLFGGGADPTTPGGPATGGSGDLMGQLSEMIQRGGGGGAGGFSGGLGQQPASPSPSASSPSATEPSGTPANPLEALLGGLLGSRFGGGAADPARTRQPGSADAPPFDPGQFGLEQLTRMFESGRAVQDQNAAAMQSIFDSLSGTGPVRP